MKNSLILLAAAVMAMSPLTLLADNATTTPTEKVKVIAPEGNTETISPNPNPAPTTVPIDKKAPGGLFDSSSWPLIALMVGVLALYIWMGRGRRKTEAKRKALLSNIKKGDKITTIGGIIGTIIEMKENEVTIKTDESNNVRMKFARWAIRDVGEPGKNDTAEDKKT